MARLYHAPERQSRQGGVNAKNRVSHPEQADGGDIVAAVALYFQHNIERRRRKIFDVTARLPVSSDSTSTEPSHKRSGDELRGRNHTPAVSQHRYLTDILQHLSVLVDGQLVRITREHVGETATDIAATVWPLTAIVDERSRSTDVCRPELVERDGEWESRNIGLLEYQGGTEMRRTVRSTMGSVPVLLKMIQ